MRVLLRVLAPLFGLALAAAGVLLAIEVVAAWTRIDTDQSGVLVPWPQWRAVLEDVRWSDQPVPWIAIGVAVVGLVVLMVGLQARRVAIPLDGPQDSTASSWMTATTSPRVLARLVGKRVRKGDDGAGATVTASKRRIAVAVTGWGEVDGDSVTALRSSVAADVDELLETVPLRRRPRVAVTVTQQRGPR